MKKILLLLMSAAVMLASCTKEPVIELSLVDGERIPLNIDGSIRQVATKATAQGFVDGDAVGLYAVNYSGGNTVAGTLSAEGNQADNVKYVFDEGGQKWTPMKGVYYKDVNTNVDLYVYYPYQQGISDVSAANFEVQKDQSTAATPTSLSGYEASDWLWGKVENVTPSESKVQIPLGHKLSAVQVTLAEGSGFGEGEYASISKSVILTSTTRKATLNYATGEATPLGSPQYDGIVMCPQESGAFRAIVVPQGVPAGTQLFAITLDGVSYSFKQGEAVTYQPGKQMNVSITLSKKTPSGDYELTLASTQITDWTEDLNTHGGEARQYYVVNVETPGTLGATITAAGKNPAKIRNLKVTGVINSDDFIFMKQELSILASLNLKEVEIVEKKIPDSAFNDNTSLMYIEFPEDLEEIGNWSFYRTNISGTLVFPEGVIKIGEYAFDGCEYILGLSFPSTLQQLGQWAFSDCQRITGAIAFPNSLKYIGEGCFAGTPLTGSLTLPPFLEYLGERAFRYITDYYRGPQFSGNLEIPESLTEIGSNAFSWCRFGGTLKLHDGIKKIGAGAFAGCAFVGPLEVPKSLVKIEEKAFECNSFSSIVFHSGITEIGKEAFFDNGMIESLVIPDGIYRINRYSFGACPNLQYVELPASIDYIMERAFEGDSNIKSLVIKSLAPPYIEESTFLGVPKINTLHVPEQSLSVYSRTPLWDEFEDIAPNYGFYLHDSELIDDRDIYKKECSFNSLSRSETRTFVLKCPSGESWAVDEQSIPDWITISPISGVGKTPVVITIDSYDAVDGNRTSSVIFRMLNKECEAYVNVTQYACSFNDGDCVVLQESEKQKGVNIVIMGDGYDAKDIANDQYMNDMHEAVSYFFDIEPYKSYSDYFNVYSVIALSKESGIGDINYQKNNTFGTTNTSSRIKLMDVDKCFSYALKTPITDLSQTLVILIPNTTVYDGVTYMYADGSAIALCPKSSKDYPYDFRGIIQHEAGGHGFGKLGDEYVYHQAFIQYCDCNCCNHPNSFDVEHSRGWYKNLSMNSDLNQVPWSHLLFHPKYSDYVDMFEGGYMHSRGVFRSEVTSCMNNNIPYFSAISRQAIVERIKACAGEEFSLEDFYAQDSDAMGTKAGGKPFFDRTFGVDPLSHLFTGQAPIYMGEHPNVK